MAICFEKGYSASELEMTFGMPDFKFNETVDPDSSAAPSTGASTFKMHGMPAHFV